MADYYGNKSLKYKIISKLIVADNLFGLDIIVKRELLLCKKLNENEVKLHQKNIKNGMLLFFLFFNLTFPENSCRHRISFLERLNNEAGLVKQSLFQKS